MKCVALGLGGSGQAANLEGRWSTKYMTMCRIGATIKRHGPLEHHDQLGVVRSLVGTIITFSRFYDIFLNTISLLSTDTSRTSTDNVGIMPPATLAHRSGRTSGSTFKYYTHVPQSLGRSFTWWNKRME